MAEGPTPLKIRLDRPAGRLVVAWSDGLETRFPLDFLRAQCPSAGERVAREEKTADPLAILGNVPSHEMTDLRMVGTYAICPTWSDGHSVGIYTWEYLREIADDDRVEKAAIA